MTQRVTKKVARTLQCAEQVGHSRKAAAGEICEKKSRSLVLVNASLDGSGQQVWFNRLSYTNQLPAALKIINRLT